MRIVVGRDLDDVRADDLEALECLKDLLDLLCGGRANEHTRNARPEQHTYPSGEAADLGTKQKSAWTLSRLGEAVLLTFQSCANTAGQCLLRRHPGARE